MSGMGRRGKSDGSLGDTFSEVVGGVEFSTSFDDVGERRREGSGRDDNRE
jgi:hypothetical protein